MALDVIGAGFGRTGTLSLKLALERIGFGPCYHMMEVFRSPHFAAYWKQAAYGEPVDWDQVFAGYRATVDWPGCSYWRELSAAYPAARVILSVRDPDRWFESTRNTIFSDEMMRRAAEAPPDENRAGMMKKILGDTFGGRFSDRDHAVAVFNDHVAAVKDAIPAERLLVFDVAEGWGPLCSFLGVEVPDEPFPRTNSTEEFGDIFPPLMKE
ncbi:MAG: sulfotransferase family protein [Alphaproteobacteria bacterium]|nr:sulfotransferase family protein [Alphaproteobacteria bacterium]